MFNFLEYKLRVCIVVKHRMHLCRVNNQVHTQCHNNSLLCVDSY